MPEPSCEPPMPKFYIISVAGMGTRRFQFRISAEDGAQMIQEICAAGRSPMMCACLQMVYRLGLDQENAVLAQ